MSSISFRRLALRSCAAAALMALAAPVAAYAQAQTYEFNIPAQDLGSALRTFARQSRQQVVFDGTQVRGKTSRPLAGSHAADPGLAILLEGSGLSVTRGPRGVLMVRASVPQSDAAPATGEPSAISEVVVTGTRIAAVQDRFSPVSTVTRDSFDRAGQTSVAEVLAALPQNFGGGTSLDTQGAATFAGPGASSVNLRGLGNEATLILLNGHRIPVAGLDGQYVDIGAIPNSAVERVDVVADGASAIYGSDAIAGVVNVVLRHDFDGLESRMIASTPTQGGGGQVVRLAQTAGRRFADGNVLLTYEYAHENKLSANDRDWAAALPDPYDLLPKTEKHAVFLSGSYAPTSRVKFSGDAYYNARSSYSAQAPTTTSKSLNDVDFEQYGAVLGTELSLGGGWTSDSALVYGRANQQNTAISYSAGGTVATFGADSKSKNLAFDSTIGGSLALPVTSNVVLGVHYRREDIQANQVNLSTGVTSLNVSKQRDVYAAYAEFYSQLVSPDDGIPGVRSLDVTAAGRYEHYSDFGSTTNPRVGVNWGLFDGLNVRATYGSSFRAPRLAQLVDEISVLVISRYRDPTTPGSDPAIGYIIGNTSDLKPEKADTWSIGVDFRPPNIPNLTLRATYFSVDYKDRIATPGFASMTNPFRIVNYTGVPIRNVTPAQVQALAASAARVLNHADFFEELRPLSLSDITVLLDIRPQNLSESKASGLDLEATYKIATADGNWLLSANATYLDKFTSQFSTFQPVKDILNTYGNPTKWRVRAGAIYQTEQWEAAAFVNYVSDYADNLTVPAMPVDSWTTVDASVRFNLGALAKYSAGASATFAVTNLFNKTPPLVTYTATRPSPYDPANADPYGRRVSLTLTMKM